MEGSEGGEGGGWWSSGVLLLLPGWGGSWLGSRGGGVHDAGSTVEG